MLGKFRFRDFRLIWMKEEQRSTELAVAVGGVRWIVFIRLQSLMSFSFFQGEEQLLTNILY